MSEITAREKNIYPILILFFKKLALGERFSRICYVKYPQPSVMVFDPELVEKGMRNQGPMPSKGNLLPWTDYRMERKEQLGVLTSQGEEWHKFRCVCVCVCVCGGLI